MKAISATSDYCKIPSHLTKNKVVVFKTIMSHGPDEYQRNNQTSNPELFKAPLTIDPAFYILQELYPYINILISDNFTLQGITVMYILQHKVFQLWTP